MNQMASIHYLKGDATVPQANGHKIIAHICNNVGGWGKGFVRDISKRWSLPGESYRLWHRLRATNDFALGNIQILQVSSFVHVANMVAEQGSGRPPFGYEAVQSCLEKLANAAQKLGASVHMPRIGTGLAGGNWELIEPIIQGTLIAHGVEVYVYDFR